VQKLTIVIRSEHLLSQAQNMNDQICPGASYWVYLFHLLLLECQQGIMMDPKRPERERELLSSFFI
jgi:hypothetical protein